MSHFPLETPAWSVVRKSRLVRFCPGNMVPFRGKRLHGKRVGPGQLPARQESPRKDHRRATELLWFNADDSSKNLLP
ncbi:hypothetical protein Cob_v010198 [Colletotrichum orbiculare MAFF 240422]|uniref:Uncharacterized protein n=1 Tax=Colletotrichum orbiculare (strain 104-T / ATCC 96160 / CBS 514.97 / LARS 414 / MAFF 240422) TaxID=1213857 RepID=A0A484FEE0_COLOR|nr:hypothetical protein Cob_v010198 [Colletotrichum orbiculare MAFF 240422]